MVIDFTEMLIEVTRVTPEHQKETDYLCIIYLIPPEPGWEAEVQALSLVRYFTESTECNLIVDGINKEAISVTLT